MFASSGRVGVHDISNSSLNAHLKTAEHENS